MKTYCKNVDIRNVEFIDKAIYSYVYNKTKKDSTIKFYAYFSGKERKDIIEQMNPNSDFFLKTTRAIAEEMSYNIANHTVSEHLEKRCNGEPLIRYITITDVGSGKIRDLGLETVLFRFYEVVANIAADPMFSAKIGEFQVASIKGKGQKFGKKAISKWLSRDPKGTKYCCQADVSQCYPTIPHKELRDMFRRDIRKSRDLLYLFETIIDLYEAYPNPNAKDPTIGILIGSPVSKDMCNYYMSRIYHYAAEKLHKKKVRRGKEQLTRLLNHIIIYMDDILIYGSNKRDIQKAMNMIVTYAKKFLKLKIKPNWRKFRTMYRNVFGKLVGGIIDFMGFRFYGGAIYIREYFGRKIKYKKVWVTIRRRTFLKARRKLKRFINMVKCRQIVSYKFVKSLVSYYGCFKSTNSMSYRKRENVDKKIKIARRMISNYARGKSYKVETYYRMWRCCCA